MKKLILLLVVVFTFSNTMAQMTWMTAYKVDPVKMKDAKSAIGKKTKKYNIPVVHSMTKKGLGFVYTKTHLSENNKKAKVILNFNEKLYPYNDYKGEYGMSQISFGLKIKNKSHGDKLIRGLNSECFSEVIKATKWGAFQTDYRMFPYIKRDFFKMKLFKSGSRTLKKVPRKENKKTRKTKHRLKK